MPAFWAMPLRRMAGPAPTLQFFFEWRREATAERWRAGIPLLRIEATACREESYHAQPKSVRFARARTSTGRRCRHRLGRPETFPEALSGRRRAGDRRRRTAAFARSRRRGGLPTGTALPQPAGRRLPGAVPRRAGLPAFQLLVPAPVPGPSRHLGQLPANLSAAAPPRPSAASGTGTGAHPRVPDGDGGPPARCR